MGITIYDIAEKAKVSTATVSYVLNNRSNVSDKTRQRVMDVVRQCNYVPQVSSRTHTNSRRAPSVLYLTTPPGTFRTQSMFESDYLAGLSAAVEGLSGRLFVQSCADGGPLPELFRTERIDGVVIGTHLVETGRTLSSDYTVVALGNFIPDAPFSCVYPDNADGIAQVIDHLVAAGHKTIGFCGENQLNQCFRERFKEYLVSLHERGLPVRDDCVFSRLEPAECIDQWLTMGAKRPTALVCSNDSLACRIINAAHDRGVSVPGALSVTGFDDIEAAQMCRPPLTTVRVPRQALAEAAVAHLWQRWRGEGRYPMQMTIKPKLVVRASTAGAAGISSR